MDTLESVAVAGMLPQPRPALWRRAADLALLIAVPLAILGLASLTAWATVRVCADLRLGIDPFLDERARPRLSLYELALRGVAVDVLRQVVIVLFVVLLAAWSDGAAWPRRLGLTRPADPRRPIARAWRLWLLFLVWPVVHIAWVAGTARALHVSFGQGVHVSPFMTQTLVACWFAYVVLLAPIAEELLIRGEAFARADRLMGPAGSIAATALLFCSLHLTEAGLARPLTLLPLAVTLGWLRWRTGRLWPCMLLHAWSNAALVGYLLWPASRWHLL